MNVQLGLSGFADSSTKPTDRLLLAAFPQPAKAAAISERTHLWRSQHGLNGRLLLTERLHITLIHIGDYDCLSGPIVDRAKEAAAKIKMPSFEAVFDRVMSFQGSDAFVLLGSQENAALRDLRQALFLALKTDGPGCLSGPTFTPHITLLYDKRIIAERPVDPVRVKVSEFVLIHSLLGQTKHIPLARWPLHG